MKWFFRVAGRHAHVRVFMNGAKCGNLTFTTEEFNVVRAALPWITFINETPNL